MWDVFVKKGVLFKVWWSNQEWPSICADMVHT